jgi:hypothetical protein
MLNLEKGAAQWFIKLEEKRSRLCRRNRMSCVGEKQEAEDGGRVIADKGQGHANHLGNG